MAVTTLLNCVTNDPYKYSYTKLAIILCFNIWLYFSVYPRQVLTLFPSARGLEVTWSSVLKIGQSLFCEGPGKDPFRPDQKTPVQNFFVAGSYTKQDYIDSMEDATLSGRQASAYICDAGEELVALRDKLPAIESLEPPQTSSQSSFV
ncbi:zeta-carotene desaturase, chloroplastic/chromoplastic-like isoform X2 [Amaranthus tricolor]|uniref:zeta-carotene desaturase, chloroplastic/chromoplastic-like isoform X2 n=1 Tax=Amaranthus tricolor TaxID=29722 RepID=UPI00258329D4|nr:zeta-carotene desaturase, chloroplastic/chromoplastic-like isoform X2 [Amaranthus tricolor]